MAKLGYLNGCVKTEEDEEESVSEERIVNKEEQEDAEMLGKSIEKLDVEKTMEDPGNERKADEDKHD